MPGGIAIVTANDVIRSSDTCLRKLDFDVADLDGNMIFYGMESKKS